MAQIAIAKISPFRRGVGGGGEHFSKFLEDFSDPRSLSNSSVLLFLNVNHCI